MKYLFTAYYNDATEFSQTQEDKSIKVPNGSAFSDIDHEDLIAFSLWEGEPSNYRTIVRVDLITGEFEVGGITFSVYDKEVINRRLIYFRRNLIHFGQDQEQIGHEVSFFVGWQGNDPATGENIQRVLQFN